MDKRVSWLAVYNKLSTYHWAEDRLPSYMILCQKENQCNSLLHWRVEVSHTLECGICGLHHT